MSQSSLNLKLEVLLKLNQESLAPGPVGRFTLEYILLLRLGLP